MPTALHVGSRSPGNGAVVATTTKNHKISTSLLGNAGATATYQLWVRTGIVATKIEGVKTLAVDATADHVFSSDFTEAYVELLTVTKDAAFSAEYAADTTASEWDGDHTVLGAYHLWVDDAGLLRIKSSAPTAQDDGTVVGMQSAT